MISKIYVTIKEIIKENIIAVSIIVVFLILNIVEVPFYIEGPGGLVDLDDKVIIENEVKNKGSFNLTYVSQYKSSVMMYLLSFILPSFDATRINNYFLTDNNLENYNYVEKILLNQGSDDAILLAYQKASKDISITDEKIYVYGVLEEAKTSLVMGDQIIKINNVEVKRRDDINPIIASIEPNKDFDVEVINNGKTYIRKVQKVKIDDSYIMGIALISDYEYVANPKITFKAKKNEYGPSGGFMTALEVYNELVDEDITKGYKIAGTGTINIDGMVDMISGVKYKLKGAVKNKADIFLVPAGENYEEALREKEAHNYNIEIVSIDTFDNALLYLKELSDKIK